MFADFHLFIFYSRSEMIVQINTGNQVDIDQSVRQNINDNLTATLDRFQDRITRVQVHLNDENSEKGGAADKRCMMEARLSGLDPIAVTAHDETIHRVSRGALNKLERAIDNQLGKLNDR